MQIDSVIEALTPDIYQKFKTAIELGKWENGERLTQQQKETCMQAIIAYENHHFSAEQRTGYIPSKSQACEDDSHIHTIEQPLTFKD